MPDLLNGCVSINKFSRGYIFDIFELSVLSCSTRWSKVSYNSGCRHWEDQKIRNVTLFFRQNNRSERRMPNFQPAEALQEFLTERHLRQFRLGCFPSCRWTASHIGHLWARQRWIGESIRRKSHRERWFHNRFTFPWSISDASVKILTEASRIRY